MLIVAHGSRDPRHAATVSALAARVRSLAPGPRVAVGFLEFNVPSVGRVLSRLHAAGERHVTALPLLLSRAFHAKTDIPRVLAEESARLPGLSVRQAEVLGPGPGAEPLLVAALERRLAEAGLGPAERPGTGVVLAAAGTSDPMAIAVIEEFAREWRRAAGWLAVRPAFASPSLRRTLPGTADAVHALRVDGVRRVVVAPYVIAPGRLPDRISDGAHEARAEVVAPVLGAAPELAELLARRYWAATAHRQDRLAG
jgi:sirohydrochlorin ferrochelatase